MSNDDVVLNRNVEQFATGHQLLGDDLIVGRWSWIAGGMIVGENYGGRTRNDRSTEDLARMDNGRVEDPPRDYGWTLSDQLMLAVQRQNPERLSHFTRCVGSHEIEYVARPTDRYTSVRVAFRRRKCSFADESECGEAKAAPGLVLWESVH